MLVFPRHVRPEIASALEELFLAPSIQLALQNTTSWLLETYGARDALCVFERGYTGGKRSDVTRCAKTIRADAPARFHEYFMAHWCAQGFHEKISDYLRQHQTAVSFTPDTWIFSRADIPHDLKGSADFVMPQQLCLLIPIASDLIITHSSERPFFGYFALFFPETPTFNPELQVLLPELPDLLSAVTANFIRALISRDEMLGFYAHNVQQHLLLNDALMQHVDTDDQTTRQKLVSRMKRIATRTMLETNMILLAEREATENFRINAAPISVNNIIRDVAQQLQPLFDVAKMHLKLELTDDLPEVEADPSLIPSVIYNLVENGYKFSRRGQKVLIRTHRDENAVRIEVADNGIGIPEDLKKAIFSKHFRGANVGDIPGNGIGLYLTKKIVDAHRGELHVTKTHYAKTVFFVKLFEKIP